ncbi:MAG: S26 family signal peptidase [Desulfomonile sp.]|nr:S26 family signal peptidase [Desulfomonile sp.]
MEKKQRNAVEPSPLTAAAHRFLYGGLSMGPALKPADVLHVVPCGPEHLAVGDVVVFQPEDGDVAIVHRVIAVDGQWLTTKGDANANRDPMPISWDRIIGKVVYADGEDGKRAVHGGLRGRITASALAAHSAITRGISRLLHRPYRLLAASGVLRLLRSLLPEVRTIAIRRRDGEELHLLLGTKPIGVLPAARSRWLIRRPYRLILDEGGLNRLLVERNKREASGADSGHSSNSG